MDLGALYEKVFNAMIIGGTQKILDAGYETIKLPLVVVDTSYNLIAVTKAEILTDNIWDYFLKGESLPDEVIWSFFRDKYIESVGSSLKPVYLNWGNMDIPRISGAIRVKGVITAYIGVLCPKTEFREELIAATDIITKAIALDMTNSITQNTQNSPLLEIFTRDLLTGRFTQKKQLEAWKINFKDIFKKNYSIAVISPPSNGEFGLLKYFSTVISSKYPKVLTTIISEKLFLLFYNVESDFAMKEIEEFIYEKLYSFHAHYSLSEKFENILEAFNYRFQVEKALELGMEFHPEKLQYSYEEYVIKAILSYALKEMNPINYIHPMIYKLMDYDKENNTDYLNTLKTYVLNVCNSKIVSEKLHIHRNTLLYRLSKINEISNCDINHGEIFTRLIISFHMMK